MIAKATAAVEMACRAAAMSQRAPPLLAMYEVLRSTARGAVKKALRLPSSKQAKFVGFGRGRYGTTQNGAHHRVSRECKGMSVLPE